MRLRGGSRRSCFPRRAPAPPRKPAGPSPSRTSWPRCGAASPAWNAWAPRSRRAWARRSSRNCPDQPCPVTLLWCLGRLGARVPLYGLANTVVRREAAERWIDALLNRAFAPGRETSDAIFALSQIARYSGDRSRDLPDSLRTRCWLGSSNLVPTNRCSGPSVSTTSSKPHRKTWPWAMRCRSVCGCDTRRISYQGELEHGTRSSTLARAVITGPDTVSHREEPSCSTGKALR